VQAVKDWLSSAAAQAKPFKSPGVGDDVRIQGDGMVGACLVVDDRPVHSALFHDE